MPQKHDVSIVKWLITAGTVTGTLAGWMALASGASAASANPPSGQANPDWNQLLQKPLPTLASLRQGASGLGATSAPGNQTTATPQPTLRSVARPTAVYVNSGGGQSSPVTSTRSSKPKK